MSNGETLPGQQFQPEDSFIVPFTQQMLDKATAVLRQGEEDLEIIPQDGAGFLSKKYDTSALTSAQSTVYVSRPVTANINFPPVMTGITVTVDTEEVEGDYTSTGLALSSGGSGGSMGRNFGGKVRGSATIMPDIQPTLEQVWSTDLPATEVSFFTAGNPSLASILSRLSAILGSSVLSWPLFKPKSHVVTMIGKRVTVEYEHEQRRTIASGSYVRSEEDGSSRTIGVTVRTVQLPLSLHDELDLTFTPTTVTATASVEVNLTGSGDFTGATDNNSVTADATGSISPTSLPATSPTALPTSGKYLQDLKVDDYRYGLCKVRAVVFDFSVLA